MIDLSKFSKSTFKTTLTSQIIRSKMLQLVEFGVKFRLMVFISTVNILKQVFMFLDGMLGMGK